MTTRDEFLDDVRRYSTSPDSWLVLRGAETYDGVNIRLEENDLLRVRLPLGFEIAGTLDHLSIAGEGPPAKFGTTVNDITVHHLDPKAGMGTPTTWVSMTAEVSTHRTADTERADVRAFLADETSRLMHSADRTEDKYAAERYREQAGRILACSAHILKGDHEGAAAWTNHESAVTSITHLWRTIDGRDPKERINLRACVVGGGVVAPTIDECLRDLGLWSPGVEAEVGVMRAKVLAVAERRRVYLPVERTATGEPVELTAADLREVERVSGLEVTANAAASQGLGPHITADPALPPFTIAPGKRGWLGCTPGGFIDDDDHDTLKPGDTGAGLAVVDEDDDNLPQRFMYAAGLLSACAKLLDPEGEHAHLTVDPERRSLLDRIARFERGELP